MRLFRVWLRCYPRGVRGRHGAEMEEAYARLVALAAARGRLAGWRARLGGCVDVGVRGLGARASSIRPGRASAAGMRGSMSGLGADARLGVRMLVRQPAFTVAAVVTLGLGIGANASIFSVVYGLVLRPLPYPDAERLVMVWSANPERGWTRTDVSLADAWDWRARVGSFQDLAVAGRGSRNLTGAGAPERLEARIVTPNLLAVFGTAPLLGRGFEVADGEPGAAGVTILTHGFWQRRFGGDAEVLGRTLVLDGEHHRVIGVLPAGFVYPEGRPDLFIALREDPAAASRASHDRIAIARLAPGASVERASRDVERVAAAVAEQYPTTNRGWTASVVSLRSDLLGEVGRRATVVLMGAVAFVLLMACLNVANLLLARGSGRRREMALRGALGAARSRLLRQLLTESLILALVGGAVGVLVAIGGVRAILAAMLADLPPVLSISVDRAVLLFALAVSIGSTIVFGLIPAVRASRAAAADLHEGGRSGMTARGGRRFGGTLVVAQTALAVVLLVGGGLMMRSVVNLQRQDLGYSPEHVLTARLSPPVGSYEGVTELATFFDAVLERVRAMPGVAAAGWIQSPPLSGSNNVNTYVVEGRGTPSLDGGDPARMGYISPGYLDAVAARPLRGRDILESDREGAPRVALVNETLVRRSFGAEDPIGRALRVDEESWTIVGIVPDMRERGVNRDPEPSIYLSLAQRPVRSRTLALRVRSDPAAFAEAVQRAVQSVDPDQPIYAVQTMDELVRLRVGPFALVAGLMLAFALISLVLGAVGIYGVTAYGVGRRTGEIGVRMAIGAERGAVVRMIVAEGVRRALLGLALGVAGALLLSRAMSGLVVGVSPTDPLTIAAVVLVLFAVTLLGAWLPARRVARLDPLRALAGP